MIYSIYFGGLSNATQVPYWYGNSPVPALKKATGRRINTEEITANKIKSSQDDSFLFVITNPQLEAFERWIKAYGLEEYEVFRSPPITNPVHLYNGRYLTLVVLASKEHAWRDMFNVEEGELV